MWGKADFRQGSGMGVLRLAAVLGHRLIVARLRPSKNNAPPERGVGPVV